MYLKIYHLKENKAKPEVITFSNIKDACINGGYFLLMRFMNVFYVIFINAIASTKLLQKFCKERFTFSNSSCKIREPEFCLKLFPKQLTKQLKNI